MASSRGVSVTWVAMPSSPASVPEKMRAVNVSSLATSTPTQPGQEQRAGHVRHEAPVDLAHRQLGGRVDEADVGAEGDLDAAAEGVAVDGRDHRDGQLLPDPGRPAGRGG